MLGVAQDAGNVTTVTAKPHAHSHDDNQHADHEHAPDAHGHGHFQDQAHQNAHQHAPVARTMAQAPGFSLMRVSLGERLLMAAALSALLWVAIAGVLWT